MFEATSFNPTPEENTGIKIVSKNNMRRFYTEKTCLTIKQKGPNKIRTI